MTIVVDASFVLALGLEEERSDAAAARWQGWIEEGEAVLAPSLLAYEVTGVIRNRVHRGTLDHDDGAGVLGRLLALSIELHRPPELHVQAWELAGELGLPTAYDAHYLALARSLGAELWTLDERFFRQAVTVYPGVRTIPRKAPRKG